jgi:chemosensory pili system protein ChpA (sensor histidine kinase/response regulator)
MKPEIASFLRVDGRMARSTVPRVLVVDDDDEIREVLREVLLTAGYATETAPDGRAALDRLTRDSIVPDVVVLDLDMPGLDGAGLYRLMREDSKLGSIPVVVASGTPAAAPEGARVLPKPVDIPRLLEMVAELCGEKSSDPTDRLRR